MKEMRFLKTYQDSLKEPLLHLAESWERLQKWVNIAVKYES